MSLGPDDMPEDPYGQGGMAQLVCMCTSELFKFIFTETTVRAICPLCDRTAGEFPRTSSPIEPRGPYPDATITDERLPGQQPPGGVIGPGRDTLPGGPALQSGAAWDVPPPGVPQPNPGLPPGEVPPLPAFSDDLCNSYLRGGPYDGKITWLMDGTETFLVGGVGVYEYTGLKLGGRVIYQYKK